MLRITVDYDKCQSFGMCCLEADDVFRIEADGSMRFTADVDEARRDAVEMAANVCPTQAITVDE